MHVAIVDLQQNLSDASAARLASQFVDVNVCGIQADVTSPESVKACLAQVQDFAAGADIGAVFANAGVIFPGGVLNSSLKDWETTLDVNVRGVVITLQTFVPVLQAQNGKSLVVTTASTAGIMYGGGSYGVSKHACVALTESVYSELQQSGHGDKISGQSYNKTVERMRYVLIGENASHINEWTY